MVPGPSVLFSLSLVTRDQIQSISKCRSFMKLQVFRHQEHIHLHLSQTSRFNVQYVHIICFRSVQRSMERLWFAVRLFTSEISPIKMQQRSGVEFWSWTRVHKTVIRKFGIPCQAYSTREVSCLWHVQGRKLSCLLTFLSGSLVRGFLRVHRITSTITRVYTNLTTDSKWPVDMTKCNCSDHCSITRPLEGWASAASWSPAMAKGALASGCLESEVKTLVKSWKQEDEN